MLTINNDKHACLTRSMRDADASGAVCTIGNDAEVVALRLDASFSASMQIYDVCGLEISHTASPIDLVAAR